MLQQRDPYIPDWRQVSDYIDPDAGYYLRTSTGGAQATSTTTAATTTGRKRPSRDKIINSHATIAVRTMDAGFMGGHTSKSRPWFRMSVGDPAIAGAPGVREWMDDVTQLIRDVLARSNFYTELPNFYHDRHLFGVAAMMVEEDDQEVLRFYRRAIGTYAIALDRRGRCDSIWYGFEFTAHQIDQQFSPIVGREGLPKRVQQALSDGKLDETFWIDSLIEPNPDFKPGHESGENRAYRQVYWIDGAQDDTHGCLDYQGRHMAPMLASRWVADSARIYGPSPALDALGDIKQLQYLEGKKLNLTDLTVAPPLGLPEHMRGKGGAIRPGERLYLTPAQTGQKVEPIYIPMPQASVALAQEIQVVMDRIGKTFYADLFRMLDFLDDRTRTAYEISERKEEKVAMLGPALESLTDEVLDPVIDVTFYYLDRRGMIPDPPPALQNVTVKVEYTSMLAQAQKAAGSGTIDRVLSTVTAIAQGKQDPSVWDKVDTDYAIASMHDFQGAPARMLRDDDEVQAIRQNRQQQQQMQQMAAMAPALKQSADAAKTLGEAKAQDGSMLDNMAQSAAA